MKNETKSNISLQHREIILKAVIAPQDIDDFWNWFNQVIVFDLESKK